MRSVYGKEPSEKCQRGDRPFADAVHLLKVEDNKPRNRFVKMGVSKFFRLRPEWIDF
mgnify:CR=1 FL=1